ITRDRDRLHRLAQRKRDGERLPAVDRLWLAVMADRYDVARDDIAGMLKRHDVVPPSLALAQAATESGWGTSRFALEGNAVFGQWTFTDSHDGIVPQDRQDGQSHRIRAFDSLYDSVYSYVINLNTHQAYREFRDMRADMRRHGMRLDGLRLADTLHRYSERGADYVLDIQNIIQTNDLEQLDGARLSDAGPLRPYI
ncbi:MAG: glucosaminidase domain-containing protein, partial [Alphaproteobacteria bacterium]|nr:glucosaminidase domain-containing protein [Alphaproteobacteria bacterium]